MNVNDTAPGPRPSLSPATRVWDAWCRFWFEPISTVAIGLVRLIFGALMLLFVLLLLPDLLTWFGPRGPFTARLAEQFWGKTPHYSLLLWFPSRGFALLFFAAFSVAAVFLMIGLWTRLSAVLVFIGLVSIGYRNPLVLNGTDVALRIMAFYLIFAPAGAALSVDRLRALARGDASPRPPLAPPWAQRLMQLNLSLVYASTVLLKLKGTVWASGLATYFTFRLEEFHRFPIPFVAHSLVLINLLTYWTLATEIAMAFLVWIPVLRPFVLLSGLALHGGIEYSMNVPQFSFAMMTWYIVFVDVEALWERVLASRPVRSLQHARLYVNRDCAPCMGRARLVQALDIFQRLEIVPHASTRHTAPNTEVRSAPGSLYLQLATGNICSGADGLRWLAWRLPLLWPVAPLLAIPVLARLAASINRKPARSHQCTATAATCVPDQTATVSLPPPSEETVGHRRGQHSADASRSPAGR